MRSNEVENVLQTMQALKEEVAELKDKVAHIEIQLKTLSAQPASEDQDWQSGWHARVRSSGWQRW